MADSPGCLVELHVIDNNDHSHNDNVIRNQLALLSPQVDKDIGGTNRYCLHLPLKSMLDVGQIVLLFLVSNLIF